MTQPAQRADLIAPIGHTEAMRATAAENERLLDQLHRLNDDQWHAPTDCTGWTVRDIVVHLIGSAQGQRNPLASRRSRRGPRHPALQAPALTPTSGTLDA